MESILPAPPNATTLGLMTKYWDVGQVKTRLGDGIGMAPAAALHRIFVTHLCHKLGSFSGRRSICLAPDASAVRLSEYLALEQLDHLWEIVPQGEGNLGDRMERWFQRALAPHTSTPAPHTSTPAPHTSTPAPHTSTPAPHTSTPAPHTSTPASQPSNSHAILIGADCPTLDLPLVEEAQKRLASHDVVIGPAVDGGYYLIGLSGRWVRERLQAIFHDIPWSTDRVLDSTRERLSKARLSWSELDPQEDIDTVEELQRLRQQLRSIAGESQASPEEKSLETKSLETLGLEVERVLSSARSSEHAGLNDFGGPQT